MSHPEQDRAPETNSSALSRAAELLAGRLSSLGITLDGSETPEALEQLVEAIERFEDAVEARGGDLMVDEPPRGQKGRPDDARFRLPLRHADESAKAYVERLSQASANLRSRRHEEG